MRKRPNVAGIAWLVFVGLATAAAQSLPLMQTLWLSGVTATTRQASHEPAEVSISPDPPSRASSDPTPDSTAG